MAADVLLAFSTFPDRDTAKRIARELVNGGLVACANILPHTESIFRWNGKLENEAEVLTLFKISASAYKQFQAALKSIHPYDVPEIIAVPVSNGLPAYLHWVVENSRAGN